MTVDRVGVSFEPELLKQFDALLKKRGYTNRSEAIRDIVRKEIIESSIAVEDCEVIGTLTIMYNHHEGDVTDKLLHLQHHHQKEISFTTHIHLDSSLCLEVLILRGHIKQVNALAEQVKALKGVKHGELSITKTSL